MNQKRSKRSSVGAPTIETNNDKKTKKKMKGGNNQMKASCVISMEDYFPTEIILGIFSRLPVESILQCKLVCKTWRNLIVDPSFAQIHLERHDQNGVGFISVARSSTSSTNGGRKFHYLSYREDQNNEQGQHSHQTQITTIKINPPIDDYLIVGSCNGLLCVSVYSRSSVGLGDPVYICNPITREYVILPSMYIRHTGVHRLFSGFGYLPSTNEYKVVRIFRSKKYEPYVRRVQVYTLGDGNGWRNKGEIKYELVGNRSYLLGILANGTLHWQARGQKIVAFDLADENFRVLPPPPFLSEDGYEHFELQVLRGTLCALHRIRGGTVDVWSFKKNSNTNFDLKEQGYQHWSWSKEFSSTSKTLISNQPIALTESGEAILSYNHSTLFRYDIKTDTSNNLMELDKPMSSCNAKPHMNSFVSLKALGEKDTKVFEIAEEPEISTVRRSSRLKRLRY